MKRIISVIISILIIMPVFNSVNTVFADRNTYYAQYSGSANQTWGMTPF